MTKRTILIAEDDADLAQFLTLQCRELGFEVFRSPDALHALVGAHRVKPSLVVLDVNMPGGNGFSVCEMLRGDLELSHVPVIIMSGNSDQETLRRCKTLGAQFVPKGPDLWRRLVSVMVDSLSPPAPTVDLEPAPSTVNVDAGDSSRPKIVVVDDDPDISKILKLTLEPYGAEVFRAFSGMQGFWSCLSIRPDVIISDLHMGDGDGSYFLHRLCAHSFTAKTPVIMLTGATNPALKRQLLANGAAAYLTKPLVFDDLLRELRQLVTLAAVPMTTHSIGCSGHGKVGIRSMHVPAGEMVGTSGT